MKNSSSNPSTEKACATHASTEPTSSKQALQTQAQQILPVLTTVFSGLHYSEIAHQRLSQQSDSGEANYQGLTRGQHAQFGQVMIKWQLSADSNTNSADLAYEADVLKSINILPINENSLPAITPPILAYDNVTIQILKPSSQLTVLVMPYYPNGSLASQLNSQNHSRLTDVQKHHLIVQSALLVAKLHNTGWLHNDIKPNNILLDGSMTNRADNSSTTPDILLTDFALAEAIHDTPQNSDKCSTGGSAGTPAYLAPERWQGQGATLQSDIYAFGIMMYEILTGERPFSIDNLSGEPLRGWATQHCQQLIPELPLEYSRYQSIIDKALAKRVERRYQSMEEVVVDLERL